MLILALALGCAQQEPGAEVVFQNGLFYLMDADNTVRVALAMTGGRIVDAGIDANTKVIDLGGRTVFPAFHDAHTHLLWSGADLLLVDLYGARDLDAIAAATLEWAKANPDEAWIQGGGWDTSVFSTVLTAQIMDDIIADRPLWLYSADAHIAVVNSLALSLAGIDADTPDPPDGTIGRDDTGAPNGLLYEGAMSLVSDLIPPYATATVDLGLANAQAEANRFGITTVVDAYMEEWMLDGYVRADQAGTLTVRVHGAVEVGPADGDPVARLSALRTAYASPRVEVNAAKIFLDGILESGTAALLEPYEDGSTTPLAFPSELAEGVVVALDEAGFQLHFHAIGDAAVRQALDLTAHVEATNGPRDRRPLAAHIELIDPADIPRFETLGVFADFQALWAYPDSYIRLLTWPVIGEERSEWLYPIGAVAETGAVVVGGSDYSVTSQNPFLAIEVAVTRQNPYSNAGGILTPQHTVDLLTALRAYTSEGAKASFSEKDLGTLEPGKRADFIVLDVNPFEVAPSALSEVRVDETWMDGVQVYAREIPPPSTP